MIVNRLVVLDTNCLIQILGMHSKYRFLWSEFMSYRYTLCISNEILHEYEEILSQKASPLVADMFLKVLARSKNVIRKDPYFSFNLIASDVDDNKFVDCAIVCGADYIVSNDAHFNCLRNHPFPVVKVISLEDFAADMHDTLPNTYGVIDEDRTMVNEPQLEYKTSK